MRLQVEIAHRLVDVGGAAQVAQELRGAGLGQRQALAHLDRRGLVRDADRQQLAHTHRLPLALGPRAPAARLDVALELGQLALGALGAHRHDRHVDQDQHHEHDVGAGHELAGLASGSAGATASSEAHDGAALRPAGLTVSSPSSVRRSRRTWLRAFLAAISYFHSVTYSSAIPSSEMRT